MRNLYADLDLKRNLIGVTSCKQYDDVILKLSIYDNGEIVNLTGYTIEFHGRKPDNTAYIQNSMITYNGNVVTIECTEQFSIYPGVFEGEVLFINNSNGKKKYSFDLKVMIGKSTLTSTINSESTITLLDQIEQALDELRNISINLNQAIQVNSELKTNISDGTNLNNSLASNITTGKNLNDDLVSNTSVGNTLNDDLKNTIQSSTDINITLEDNISAGTTLNTNLANNIVEGTVLNNSLNEVKNIVENDIEEGKQIIENLKKVNSDYTNHINDDKRHFSEGQKDAFLLLLENFNKLSAWVQELLGTGYLIDEQGNYIVDEQGNKFII